MIKQMHSWCLAAAFACASVGARAEVVQWHFEGAISGLQALNSTRSGLNPVNQLGDLALGQVVSADALVDLAANVYVSFNVTVHGATDIRFAQGFGAIFSSANLPGPYVGQYLVRQQPSPTVTRAPADMEFKILLTDSALKIGAYTLQDIHEALLSHAYSGLSSSSGVGVALCGKCYMGDVQVDFTRVSVSSVPEPSTRAALALGLAALGAAGLRRRSGEQAQTPSAARSSV